MALDPRKLFPGNRAAAPKEVAVVAAAPLNGTRAERVQRVQVGLFGLFAVMLLVGLADIVITRAQQTQASAVPEAAPTTKPSDAPPARDPLAEAGVVPELSPEQATQAPQAIPQDTRSDVPPPAAN